MVFLTSLSFQSLVNPNCIHHEEFMLIACCLKNFPRKIFQHWMEVDSKSEFQWQTLYFHLFTLRALLHTGFLSHNPTLFAYPSIFVQIPIHFSHRLLHPSHASRSYLSISIQMYNFTGSSGPKFILEKVLYMNIVFWFRVCKLHEKTNATCM